MVHHWECGFARMLMYSSVDSGTQGDEWVDALALGMELVQHQMAFHWGKKN